jgi:outer membrane protein OmpA-like peptidoglycan-associated protein
MNMIRAALVPFATALLLQVPTSALAQTAETNPDVVPAPATPGDGVLLYPGGQYGRVTHPLLQPGAPYPGSDTGPIHLHMPKTRVVKIAPPPETPPAAVASTSTDTSVPPATDATPPAESAPPAAAPVETPPPPAPPPPPPPKPAKPAKKVQVANTPPPKPPAPQPPSSNLASGAVPFSLTPGVPVTSAPEPKIARTEPPPQQTMPAGPTPGLIKQMQIIFAPGVPDPSPDAIDAIKGLGMPLNSALSAGASRIQVVAYGGARGDKGSDARRLSLKRARIIRQLLIDGGVPADRIDVRAMGGATDSNAADRVDIFTKA